MHRRFLHLAAGAFFLAVCPGLTVADCSAETTYALVSSTPFDRQMLPTLPLLQTPPRQPAGDISFATINRWILELRMIPYEYSVDWNTPAQLATAVVTDCKGKSALLYARLRAKGVTQLHFVIGRRRAGDLTTHAWLEWRTNRGTYLLDPTFQETALPVRALDRATYIPQYAYDGSRKYRIRRGSGVPAPVMVKR